MHTELKVMQAFTYRYHLQWFTFRKILDDGGIRRLADNPAHFLVL